MRFFKKISQCSILLLMAATLMLSACSYEEWRTYNSTTASTEEKDAAKQSGRDRMNAIFFKGVNGLTFTEEENSAYQAFVECGVENHISDMCRGPRESTTNSTTSLVTATQTATSTTCVPAYSDGCHCVRCP